MFSVAGPNPSLTRNTYDRRSFSASMRSSIDNASHRLSLSGKSSRRSSSMPRSVSSMSDRQNANENGSEDAARNKFTSYTITSGTDFLRASTLDLSIAKANSNASTSSLQKPDIADYDGIPSSELRSSSVLSMQEDTPSSTSLSNNTKWYRRFSRAGSGNRLSKALDTAEAAFSANQGKSYNPFSRRRSIPATTAQTKHSILGQTTKKAIEIGGHASQASKCLPRSLLPTSPIELPYIVDACVTWLLENHAQMTPGIFRINGSIQAVKTIVDHFSAGSVRVPLETIALPASQLISVHDVASCLKKFLVLLPGGLLGEAAFESLLAAYDEQNMSSPDMVAKDISDSLRLIKDIPKFSIVTVLFALLHHIAEESSQLAKEDDPKQDTGYMTSFSLGIVFSPTCLGTQDGAADMRRSSTSYSDRSAHSDSTPIEEAVAQARQGAKVVQMLIDRWPDVIYYLAMSDTTGEDSVALLDFVSRPEPSYESRSLGAERPLQTILDSPIKDIGYAKSHCRSESIDTVTIAKRRCDCASSLLVKDAQMELLMAKMKKLEQENLDVLSSLRAKSEEAAALFNSNLDLMRENARLKTTITRHTKGDSMMKDSGSD